jgi:hypothetical protein
MILRFSVILVLSMAAPAAVVSALASPAATSPSAPAAYIVNGTGPVLLSLSINLAALDAEDLALHQGPADPSPGGLKGAGQGGPGHVHALCGGLLVETFQIHQAQSLQFVQTDLHDLQASGGAALGLEDPLAQVLTDGAATGRSRHGLSFLERMII